MTEAEQLFNDNKKLVYLVLNKIGVSRRNAYYEDLIQDGMIALYEISCNYNKEKTKKFSTIAAARIKSRIIDSLKTNNQVMPKRFVSIYDKVYPSEENDCMTYEDKLSSDEEPMSEKLMKEEIALMFENSKEIPLDQKKCFVGFLQGKTVRQICIEENLTTIKVINKIKKAKKALKKQFKVTMNERKRVVING